MCGGAGIEPGPYEDKPMTEEDLQVLNDMRPDLLRQWIIEKMLENGAVRQFDTSGVFVFWADALEQYIKKGKDPND